MDNFVSFRSWLIPPSLYSSQLLTNACALTICLAEGKINAAILMTQHVGTMDEAYIVNVNETW